MFTEHLNLSSLLLTRVMHQTLLFLTHILRKPPYEYPVVNVYHGNGCVQFALLIHVLK